MTRRLIAGATLAGFGFAAPLVHGDLVGRYYVLPNAMEGHLRHVDVQRGIDGHRVPGLVERSLGPNGLPVATTYATTRNTGSGRISDLNSDNEILWWKPGRHADKEVMIEKTQLDPSSLNLATDFFIDGNTGNQRGFRSVHWQQSLSLGAGESGTLSMALLADDDAWVFVDGELALDHGGVKSMNSAAPVFTTLTLGSGTHAIDIFYADRYSIQAGIVFQSVFQLVPAPGMLAGLTVAGVAAARRRRR
ncbi:MAG: hypothetical protein IT438_08160 [Phycisphaerales bacterium]|nr:hypothetical protein [Phycisphaerales bacterium]